MSRLSLLPTLIVCACLGCAPTAPPPTSDTPGNVADKTTPTAPPNPDFATVTAKDGSFTIRVPKDWVIASRSEPRFVNALKKVGGEARIASIERIMSDPAFKLMVMDTKGIEAKKDFVDNLNVVAFAPPTASIPTDMKLAAEQSCTQVFGSGAHKVSVLDTPNGKIGKYSGSTSIGSDSKHELVGGVLVHDGQVLTISLSAAAGEGEKMEKLFDEIVATISFK